MQPNDPSDPDLNRLADLSDEPQGGEGRNRKKPGRRNLQRGGGGQGVRRRRLEAEAADQTTDDDLSVSVTPIDPPDPALLPETGPVADSPEPAPSVTEPTPREPLAAEGPLATVAAAAALSRPSVEQSDPGQPPKTDTSETPEPPSAEAPPIEAEEDESDVGPGRKGKGRGRRRKAEPKVIYIPPPTVGGAKVRTRHWGLLLSFLLIVVAPFLVSGWYLTERAVDQYASTMGFSVRKEESGTNFDSLGSSIFDFGSQSSSDTDVLYEFIQSQELVERVDARLDLHSIYTKPDNDPVFALPMESSIEDLVDYWQRMVTIFYDAGSGLMEVRVLAFDPQDAQNINKVIFEESSLMINDLTDIARDDSTKYAREDLERGVELLRQARVAITNFRAENQFVSPDELIGRDNALLGALNQQLAGAEIDLALLEETARDGDPRLRTAEQRIIVIRNKIAEEEAKFGAGGGVSGREAYATLVGDYESLVVDREFAESAYLAALSNFSSAQAEATRQTRYLAPHIRPTLAETAEYPRREVLLSLLGLILLMGWAIVAMLYYSVKDRR